MPVRLLFQFSRLKHRMGIEVVAVIIVAVIIVAFLWYLGRSKASVPASFLAGTTHGNYMTGFQRAENPIFENGNWINGLTNGADWANVRVTPGFAFGTESGKVRYRDSTALLTGTWGPNQTVQATVRAIKPNDDIYEEVELRLRSSLAPHRATGYEANFRCSKTAKAYTQIVRWNGRLGSFTILKTAEGSRFGVRTGDVVKATIVGNMITSYINGIKVLQASDDTYRQGSPGIGFYLERATGINADFGFTSFSATD